MYNDKDSDPAERIPRNRQSGYRGPRTQSDSGYDEFEEYGIDTSGKPGGSKGITEMYDAYLKARRENEQRNGPQSYDAAREFYHHDPNSAPKQRPQEKAAPKATDRELYMAAARDQERREAESRAAVEKARRERAEAAKRKSQSKKSKKSGTESRKAAEARATEERSSRPSRRQAEKAAASQRTAAARDRKKTKKNRKKKSGGRIVLVLLLLILVAAGAYGINLLSKIQKEHLDDKELGIVPVDGYTNILLLGVDSRDMDDTEGARTDAIMIMSINEETGDISLTSIYRDTYLRMGGTDTYDKITHAHSYGGPKMVIRSLNEAMDLNIHDYVLFNFKGVADVVDYMGGITLNIEEYEIEELNKYTKETAKIIGRKDYHLVKEPGEQVLDGCQAVSYGRIRKGVGDDFKRTERMRTVMKVLMARVHEMNAFELTQMAKVVLPSCRTSFGNADLIKMALRLKDADIKGSKGFPYSVTYGMIDGVSYVMSKDLAEDVTTFHKNFFGQEDYEPSETVLGISEYASNPYGE